MGPVILRNPFFKIMLSNYLHTVLGNYPFLITFSYLAFAASMLIIGFSMIAWTLKKTSRICPKKLLSFFLGILAAREVFASLEFFTSASPMNLEKNLKEKLGTAFNQEVFSWTSWGLKGVLGLVLTYAFFKAFYHFCHLLLKKEPSQPSQRPETTTSHFKQETHEKSVTERDVLLDASSLSDPRILDLARSHFLDKALVVSESLIHSLQKESTEGDEKATLALEFLTQLEAMPHLTLRRISEKHNRSTAELAKQYGAKMLVRDAGKLSPGDEPYLISLNNLSMALKPLARSGETLPIKIQRYGKEPRQGVGYLEDGSMVVVNGGAEYIGKTIEALVLSVKHTSSGRMIFCNTTDDEEMCVSHAAPKKSFFQPAPRPIIQE